MNTLHLKGYVVTDYDNIVSLVGKYDSEEDTFNSWDTKSIPQAVEDFAHKYGWVRDYDDGLGGTKSFIENANLCIYVTDKECSLEEAQDCLIRKLFGEVRTDLALDGYSEYTITSVCLEDFSIGGHDLNRELKSHYGKYIHFVLKV